MSAFGCKADINKSDFNRVIDYGPHVDRLSFRYANGLHGKLLKEIYHAMNANKTDFNRVLVYPNPGIV